MPPVLGHAGGRRRGAADQAVRGHGGQGNAYKGLSAARWVCRVPSGLNIWSPNKVLLPRSLAECTVTG